MPTECPTCHSENPEDKPFCADCGTKLRLAPDAPPSVTKTLDLPTQGLAKGSVFADRYEIIEQLGEGGMGQVYRAHDTQIQEDIAIKVLRPEIALDKRILERFRNELKFARKITHKSVCRMHDISVSNGTTYITMEYVEGEDLKSMIQRKGKLGIGQAMGVVIQIADGLVEAHNLGIVHRDLKPQNIMIDPDGNAKIMDFGIARSTQAEGVTQEGSIIGTPEYMSPEQVEGRTVDQRSDIYSLGIIIFEMVTGQVPFSGETILDIALKHKSQEPEHPQQYNKKIPDTMADLVLRSMAKDPAERFQSAEELLKALLSIEEILPESERSAMRIVPRLPGAKAAPFSLKKVLFPIAAVAAIVVLALITWRLLFPPQPTDVLADRATVAVLYFKNNTGDPSFDQWRMSLQEMLIQDLMQSLYLDLVTSDRIYSFLTRKDLLEARNYTAEDLKELTAEVRATHFVQGYLTKSGDNFKLSLNLQDAKDLRLLGAVDSSGLGQESFVTMVDELTIKIKPHFGLTTEDIENDIDEDIAETTTPIPAAFNFYAQAQKAKAVYRYDDALDLLERAIILDPDFALAYSHKARLLANQSFENIDDQYKAVKDAVLKAYEAIQRRPVTKREQLKIEAAYRFWIERDQNQVMERYKELVESYPDDYDGNHSLATQYFVNYEDRERALKHYNVVLHLGKAGLSDYGRIEVIYNGRQQYQEAKEALNLGLEQLGEKWELRAMLTRTFFLEGQYDRALEECEKMYLIDPLETYNHMYRGNTYYFMEDFQAAEEEYRKFLNSDKIEERTAGRRHLIALYKLQGCFDDVIEQAKLAKEDPQSNLDRDLIDVYISRGNWDEAYRACQEWNPGPKIRDIVKSHKTAFIKAKLNQWKEAQTTVDELNNRIRDTSKVYFINLRRRFVLDLQGRLEMERGNYSQAIDYLEQVKKLLPGLNDRYYAWQVDALARAYMESGELEKAREEYKLIASLKGGRYEWGDIYAKAFYMLGKIAEELGEKNEARRQYTRFLELWKDADPDLPELEDAKKRLSALK